MNDLNNKSLAWRELPRLQPNWPGACPMLVAQLVVLNLIHNSHRHVLVVYSLINSWLSRTRAVIHVHLIFSSANP